MCVKHCASELEFHKTHVFNLFLLLLLLYPFVIILCSFSSLSLPLPPFTRLLQCYVPINPVVCFHPATPLSNTCRAFTFNYTIYSSLHLISSAHLSLVFCFVHHERRVLVQLCELIPQLPPTHHTTTTCLESVYTYVYRELCLNGCLPILLDFC